MDTVNWEQRERAEHLSRQAAANARAAYYAHPSLHFDNDDELPQIHDPDAIGPEGVGSLNQSFREVQAARAASKFGTTNEIAEKQGTNEAKKEEAGGMENVAPPSGEDKGAREYGGEAGGTHTSPGPSAALVHTAVMAQAGQLNGVVRVDGAIDMPDDKTPGAGTHWSQSHVMEPHLQLMCGPLLSYYTIRQDVWHGAIMVVTADEGSVLQPAPLLSMEFYPYISPVSGQPPSTQQVLPPQRIPSQCIHTYKDENGSNSFWRFMIQVPVQDFETSVRYRLNGGAELRFVVPARGQNLRWAAHSCNGFSSGVNPDDFKGEKFTSGYDPLWEDMLAHHHQVAYHCMVGGGDQIYCDALTREEELQSWINAIDRKAKLGHPLTDVMKHAVDRFYFNHYCKIFRSNAFGRANSTIPMVNMLDDHDLIDGFGTYDDETQSAPVFSFIGSRGYFWYLLFQLFTVDDIDGLAQYPQHPIASFVIGEKGPWIPYHSHSLTVYLGPQVQMFALDCRAERKLTQIVTPQTYAKMFAIIEGLPAEVEHLVLLLGVPIAYPRMSFVEHFLEAKWNPITILARKNALGLGSMVNKFNHTAELLDDLNDHWCANTHKKERNWLVLEMQRLALECKLRITFLSGDVHLAAVGALFTYKHRPAMEMDHRYMLNIITSAIVNTPPPGGAALMVAKLSSHKHRTLHSKNTDERMLPLFKQDTDGSKQKRPYVLARRNYSSVQFSPESGELCVDIRVEKKPGIGETVVYSVAAPPPRWSPGVPAPPNGEHANGH